MGTTQSRSAAPFAIDDAANTELNRLSFIAARFLGTSDIYDIENLVKPGTCGNYSMFMRKSIETTLLPFVVDLSDGATAEVFYQDPRKAIDNQDLRRKFCKQLTTTMVQAIATITAALASIQVVKSRSREAVVALAPGGQRGGGVQDVGSWLETAGYISRYVKAGDPMEFRIPGGRYPTPNVRFYLTINRASGTLTDGTFNVEGTSEQMRFPRGGLSIDFLYGVQLPGTTQKKVLPIRVWDRAGLTWFAGILIDEKFKSFVDKTPETYITRLLEQLFITAAGGQVQANYPETREEIKQAEKVFSDLHRSNDPNIMIKALNRYFTETVAGYQPIQGIAGYPAAGYPIAGVYPGYPLQPQYPAQQLQPLQYGIPRSGPVTTYPLQPGLGPVTFRPTAADGQYDIQGNAAVYIRKMLDGFRRLIATQSCPAEERAAALFGSGYDEKQYIRTGVCADPYWRKTNLIDVYPWATFQFLSTKDWDKAGDRADNYESEWREFVDGLAGKYGTQHFGRPAGTYNLEMMRFLDMGKFVSCEIANQAPVLNALNRIQALYTQHNTRVWNIVNELIIRIKHPETNKDIIRLHPKVIGGSSATYVKGKAAELRRILKEHYLEVEQTYIDAMRDPKFIKR